MKAESIISPTTKPLTYSRYSWGENWDGTKEQLQAVGIATGLKFPGEPGGPVRKMTVIDRLGLKVEIIRDYDRTLPQRYDVRRPFRDGSADRRARRAQRTTQYAPGVTLYKNDYCTDDYTGTAEALVGARLVRLDQLPGQPGRGKVRTTFDADGAYISKNTRNTGAHRYGHGYTAIEVAGKHNFTVCVRVSEEEAARREVEFKAFQEENMRANLAAQPMHIKNEGRIKDLDAQIAQLSVSEDQYRERAQRMLKIAFEMLAPVMFKRDAADRSTGHSGRWSHSKDVFDEFCRHYWQLKELIDEGDIECDDSLLHETQRARSALDDEDFQGLMTKLTTTNRDASWPVVQVQ